MWQRDLFGGGALKRHGTRKVLVVNTLGEWTGTIPAFTHPKSCQLDKIKSTCSVLHTLSQITDPVKPPTISYHCITAQSIAWQMKTCTPLIFFVYSESITYHSSQFWCGTQVRSVSEKNKTKQKRSITTLNVNQGSKEGGGPAIEVGCVWQHQWVGGRSSMAVGRGNLPHLWW